MATNIKTVMTYPLDGSTTDFDIPFEYLARKFIQVTLIGIDRTVLVLNTDYRFATKTTISTTRAWGPGDGYQLIEVRRYTSATDRLVDFTDGSILRAYDLNVSQIQTLHVAEEARDLTADTIGVNDDGDLDARGRRIVNLALAVEDTDAITFGQVKSMGTGAYQSAAAAKASEIAAKTSETNSKTSETNSKTSEINAKSSENSALQSSQNAAGSNASALQAATNAQNSQNAAYLSETNAKTSEINAKASENAARNSADQVQTAVESYGALPVGTVVTGALDKPLPGFLALDGSTFNAATYPALYAYLGTTTLPDWRNRYLKMADVKTKVGVKGAWGVKVQTGTAAAGGAHTHVLSIAANGAHVHGGSTGISGAHTHGLVVGVGGNTGSVYRINQAQHAASTANDRIVEGGAHSHNFTTASAGSHGHTGTANSDGNHGHSVTIPAQGSGENDMDHVKVWYYIKAFGTTDAEQMAVVSAALNDIQVAVNTANDAKDTAEDAKDITNSFEGRVSGLEGEMGTGWLNHNDPRVLEYIDWSGNTPSTNTELWVKITDREIYVYGIVRPTTTVKKNLWKFKKPLPGTTAASMTYTPAMTNTAAGVSNFGSMYINYANAITTFPMQVSVHAEAPVAWYMIPMHITRFA